jgi:LCP family protein required for cell wall assembly
MRRRWPAGLVRRGLSRFRALLIAGRDASRSINTRRAVAVLLAAGIAVALLRGPEPAAVLLGAARVEPSAPATPPLPPVPRGDNRFLVVGLTQDRHRTDSIMVIQWDDLHHAARILGVPRDIRVNLQGIGNTKLAHAYATGSIGRARAAVVKLLNIPIAHYVVFSLPGMRHLVDLIGGVPLTVEKRMVYSDRGQGLFINLQPGPQVLDGAHAEQYLRFRNDPEGDIGRIRRQQHFVRAALTAVHQPAIWMRLPQIIDAARADVDTDLTTGQMLGWVRRVQGVTPDAIGAYSIEGRPAFEWDDLARMKLDFWEADPDDLRAKVRWLISGVTPPLTKP